MPGRLVEFFLNGVSQGTAFTNSSSIATKTIALGTTAIGTHTPPGAGLHAGPISERHQLRGR
ncbi:MAG: hypothetical protein U0232_07870 [Thermomicrobiales bacterium]